MGNYFNIFNLKNKSRSFRFSSDVELFCATAHVIHCKIERKLLENKEANNHLFCPTPFSSLIVSEVTDKTRVTAQSAVLKRLKSAACV